MSVVPLSSPLSSSNNEKDSSSVSTLLCDYTLLNTIVDTNQFEQTLQIYSLMLNHFFNQSESSQSLQNLLQQFIDEYSQSTSNEIQQLIQIFENLHIHSLISSYDSILHKEMNSLKKDHVDEQSCIISMSEPIIDEENYASKLLEYNVTRLKIVRLEKRVGEPLGATICRLSDHDYRISIARIVHGSISQGLFSVGDQILEINQISIQSQYRTLDEIVQLIDSLHGTITFLLLPVSNDGNDNHAFEDHSSSSSIFVRTLFSYDPYDDMYIPCRELGLSFEKGSILEIVNRDDSSWWQALIMENEEKKTKTPFPGLIPSKQFQEKRLKIVKCLLDEETNDHRQRSKKKLHKSISRQKILTTFNFGIYEPVQWFIPDPTRKRPIVFIGAPHIGRHELRQRLMNSSDLSTIIDVAVPHTTRVKKDDEIDGRDYHFITRTQFEKDIRNDLFVEHGEYEKNLYGTSKSAIETCCHILNKICILNLLPEGLDSLKYSNLVPFIIYIKAPTTIDQLREYFPQINEIQWNEIEEKSRLIEQNYSHLFDQVIHFNHSFDELFQQLKSLIQHVQNKLMWVNQCWFAPRERF